jgi:response regulator RpfG family c-di-GMP phosphodiesterase
VGIDLEALPHMAIPVSKSTSNQPLESLKSMVFRPARILIMDDEALVREVLLRKLASQGYTCECCENGRAALDLLASKRFDLVLADALMPEIGGLAFLREAMMVCPDVAVIMATSVVDIDVAVDSLKDGAYDWITKPFSLEEVIISISRALEKRRLLIENRNYQRTLEEQVASRTSQLQEALKVLEHTYHSTLVALSKALDSRDRDADSCSLRVTVCERLGRQLGLSKPEMCVIEQGALLHDIGKIGVPDNLLRKCGGLSDEEQLMLTKHPEIGYRILSSIKFLAGAARLVWHHHERYDGSGYPQCLRGEEIDRGARIFAIAEALEELASDSSSGEEAKFEAAIQEVARMSGSRLDPQLVKEFLKIPVQEWIEIRKEVPTNMTRTDLLQKAM